MQLSKKERKFRTRLIQENHFNKQEQRKLDVAHNRLQKTFTKIYRLERNGHTHFFMAEIATSRLSKAMSAAGVSAKALSSSVRALTAAFQIANTAGGNNI